MGTRRSATDATARISAAVLAGALLAGAACTTPGPVPPPSTPPTSTTTKPAPPVSYRTKDFTAFVSAIPPGPRKLIVAGTVVVGHPGHRVTLKPAQPQGFNPRILLMNLTVERVEGNFPQVVTDVPVRYEEVGPADYDRVTILPDGIDLPVQIAY